jgi:hypothetical protein
MLREPSVGDDALDVLSHTACYAVWRVKQRRVLSVAAPHMSPRQREEPSVPAMAVRTAPDAADTILEPRPSRPLYHRSSEYTTRTLTV